MKAAKTSSAAFWVIFGLTLFYLLEICVRYSVLAGGAT
jgi:hypothetical protein